MSLLYWNYRRSGCPLSNNSTCPSLGYAFSTNHIFFFIETKATSITMESIRVKLGFPNCFLMEVQGHNGGLALLWYNCFDLVIQAYSSYHISSLINTTQANIQWRLTCIYGESHLSLWPRFWSFFKPLHNWNHPYQPWLCIGDWNELLHLSEKMGGSLLATTRTGGMTSVW